MTTLTSLCPKTLRDLASAIEYRLSRTRALHELTPEGVEKLADIYLAGSMPTVGFFARYGSKVTP